MILYAWKSPIYLSTYFQIISTLVICIFCQKHLQLCVMGSLFSLQCTGSNVLQQSDNCKLLKYVLCCKLNFLSIYDWECRTKNLSTVHEQSQWIPLTCTSVMIIRIINNIACLSFLKKHKAGCSSKMWKTAFWFYTSFL